MGIRLDEPVVTLSNIVMAFFCLLFAYKLIKNPAFHPSKKWFIGHFITLAIATLFGGFMGHCFLYVGGMSYKIPGWLIGILAVNFLEIGTWLWSRSQGLKINLGWGLFFSALHAIVFAVLAVVKLKFLFVALQSVVGLLGVVLLLEFKLKKNPQQAKASKWMIRGIYQAGIAAFVFALKLSPHEYFNHLVFGHLFMVLSSWAFYKGVEAKLESLEA